MTEEVKKTDVNKPEEAPKDHSSKKSKKRHIWRWVAGGLAVLILIPLLILTYLGLVPGLSSVFGFNKPKDLGVRYSAADYASYTKKTGKKYLDFANAPDNPKKPGKKIVFADPKKMNVNLTQEEITAAINNVGWAWMPIKNAQVRFSDGAVEVSGNINAGSISNFINFIGGVGYPQSSVNKAVSWAKLFGNPPVYVKANASVVNNVLALQVSEAQVGRFNVPLSISEKVLKTGTINIENNSAAHDIQQASFQNGSVHFVGISPTTIYVKH